MRASQSQVFLHCLNRHLVAPVGKAFHLFRIPRVALALELKNSSRHSAHPHDALRSKNWYTERMSGRNLRGKVRTSSESPTFHAQKFLAEDGRLPPFDLQLELLSSRVPQNCVGQKQLASNHLHCFQLQSDRAPDRFYAFTIAKRRRT